MNEPFKITELWAFVSVAPDGDEGVCGFHSENGVFWPMVCADVARLRSYFPISHHPKDEEHRYCGACHQFHDTMTENETDLREKTLELLMKWRDEFKEGVGIYKITEMLFTLSSEKQPDAAQFCRDLVIQSEANAKRLEKIIINYNAPKP